MGNEATAYWLNIGNLSKSSVDDSLRRYSKDCSFGTWDKDPAGSCSSKRGGGWWYSTGTDCAIWSNLNGVYPRSGNMQPWGMIYWSYLDSTSPTNNVPTSSRMKIKPAEI